MSAWAVAFLYKEQTGRHYRDRDETLLMMFSMRVQALKPESGASRQAGIDTLRVFAMLAIVAIHTNYQIPTESLTASLRTILSTMNQFHMWGVPFFFMAAGYFSLVVGITDRIRWADI